MSDPEMTQEQMKNAPWNAEEVPDVPEPCPICGSEEFLEMLEPDGHGYTWVCLRPVKPEDPNDLGGDWLTCHEINEEAHVWSGCGCWDCQQ